MQTLPIYTALLAREKKLAEMRNRIHNCIAEPVMFVNWLSNRNDREEIGKAGRSNLEPLTQFLQSSTGYECEVISNEKIRVSSILDKTLSQEVDLYGWATRYLKAITQNGIKYGDSVTAKDCLFALEQV